MPRITYRHRGGEQVVDVEDDTTVMRAAVAAGVPGIVGQCGGQAVCATCHVYVDEVDRDLPPVGEDEDDMLDEAAAPRREGSRLGCQIVAGEDFTDLTVTVADA